MAFGNITTVMALCSTR
jgi:hypothetical protein